MHIFLLLLSCRRVSRCSSFFLGGKRRLTAPTIFTHIQVLFFFFRILGTIVHSALATRAIKKVFAYLHDDDNNENENVVGGCDETRCDTIVDVIQLWYATRRYLELPVITE